ERSNPHNVHLGTTSNAPAPTSRMTSTIASGHQERRLGRPGGDWPPALSWRSWCVQHSLLELLIGFRGGRADVSFSLERLQLVPKSPQLSPGGLALGLQHSNRFSL